MKINDHYHKGPVQDLLNAVVVQAAEDYREYSAKLIVKPGSRQAAKDLEEVISFFLSEDFCFYTKVGGDYILKKLEEEKRTAEKLSLEFRAMAGELVKMSKEFSAGGYQDIGKLEQAASLIQRVKEIQKHPLPGWKKLFVLKTAEKTAIRNLKRWRQEYEQKNRSA